MLSTPTRGPSCSVMNADDHSTSASRARHTTWSSRTCTCTAENSTSYAWLSMLMSSGRHFRRQSRTQFVALAGVTALTHRTHFTGFINLTPRDGTPPTHTVFDDRDVEQWVALTLGVEMPLVITRHVRLVPEVRTHQVANAELGEIFPSGKSVLRPRLALRWQF